MHILHGKPTTAKYVMLFPNTHEQALFGERQWRKSLRLVCNQDVKGSSPMQGIKP